MKRIATIYKHLVLVLLLMIPVSITYCQLAFPGAEGYGAITRGAYAGSSTPKILIVDNLDSGTFGNQTTGRGTFTWCINQPYPRIVLFEVAGTIDYRGMTNYINIREPYLTIAGQTAPGVGINIIGTMITIRARHVVIQHLRIRHGDAPGMGYNDRDCLGIFSDNVMVDHCSFSWSMDNIIDVYSHDVTFSNCIFSEPLHYSNHFDERGNHIPEGHGFGVGFSSSAYNITLKNNLFAYSYQRNPMTTANSVVIINNWMYNSGRIRMGVNFAEGRVNASYVGNVILRSQNTTSSLSEYAGFVMSEVLIDSRIYVDDNICTRSIKNPSLSERGKFYVENPDFQFAGSSPINLTDYNIINASSVEDYVLENAGAKPFNRESVDQRIIQNAQNRTGEFINSQGPLPARAYNFDRVTTGTTAGYMENGYDWSTNPSSFVVNGKTIQLNQDCNNIQDVINHIDPQMPSGTEAYIHPCNTYIGIRTLTTGSSQSLTVSGSGLAYFGIPEGTHYGSDGVGGFPLYSAENRALSSIANYPESDPHGDDNGNNYTNLEDWLYTLGQGSVGGATIVLGNNTLPAGPTQVCQGSSDIEYTTIGTSEATSYSWEITPSTAGTIEGDDRNAIVDFNPSFSGDCRISFYAYAPGYTAVSPQQNIHVISTLVAPDLPYGPDSVFQNQITNYTTTDIQDASGYTWTLDPPESGTLTASFNSCSIRWSDENYVEEATLTVNAISSQCGDGYLSQPLAIKINEVQLGYGIINVFTPNGDGFNDYWTIPFIRDFPDATVKIFDRNNKLLIEYKATDASWNGTVNGELVPMGNYLYVIELGEGKKPLKGYVTVLH
jgi:gliding motility-associated-like protein